MWIGTGLASRTGLGWAGEPERGWTGAGDSLPFRPFSAVWVEISGRQLWDSLPFSAVFRCLGRDFRTVALGFSTISADFCYLGRDFRTAALGFSTISADFLCLGRDFPKAASGFSTIFAGFSLFG